MGCPVFLSITVVMPGVGPPDGEWSILDGIARGTERVGRDCPDDDGIMLAPGGRWDKLGRFWVVLVNRDAPEFGALVNESFPPEAFNEVALLLFFAI